MKVYGRMGLQPGQHFWGLVSGGVVQDDVQIASLVLTVERLKESQKIGGGMCCRAFTDDRSGSDVQSGIQADQAISFVIVGLAGGQSRPQGQQRLSSTERLNLSLLVDTKHDGIGRRV